LQAGAAHGYTSVNASNTINLNASADFGVYQVILTEIATGCADTATTTFSQDSRPPMPMLTLTDSVCLGDTLRGTAMSAGADDYIWFNVAFPALVTLNGATVEVPADTALLTGQYGVYATSDQACVSDTAFYNALVIDPRPALPVVSNDTACEGGNAAFEVENITPGYSYQWTSTLGLTATTDTLLAVNLAVTAADSVFVTAVNDLLGCTSEADTSTLLVNANPSVSAPADDTLCDGQNVNLDASPVLANHTYSWSGPNGYTSANATNTHTLNTAADFGAYIVTVTEDATGCSSTDTVVYTQETPPPSPVAVNNLINLCAVWTPCCA
jgi:hypothetical protein